MALPTIVKNATSADDGVANSLASNLSKLRAAKRKMNTKLGGVNDIMGTFDSGNLPNLPSVNDISSQADVAESLAGDKLNELNAITDLTGSCLDGAIASMKSMVKDSSGLIDSSTDAFSGVADMPSQMFDIMKVYGATQEFLGSLGIDQLVGDMMGKLGCLSDSSMISDVTSEIGGLMAEMGLGDDGKVNEETYYNKMKSDLSLMGGDYGIDTSFTDSMTDGLSLMTTKTNELASSAKDTAAGQISAAKTAIKNSVPKTPTPSSLF